MFYFVDVGQQVFDKNVGFGKTNIFLAFLTRSYEMQNMFLRLHFKYFQSIGPLGRCFLLVEMFVCVFVRVSVCLSVCLSVHF